MEKDKSPNIIGNNFGQRLEASGSTMKPVPSSSSSSSSTTPDFSNFSNDISRMPDNPPKNLGHRRAHSEILTLPDDISFNSDLGVVFSDETEEDLFSMYLDMEKFNSSSAKSGFEVGDSSTPQPENQNEIEIENGVERLRVRHQHSQSMDGSTAEMLTSSSAADDARKSMSAAKLAELALVDPKRAKRIWANRQSAARSKERKIRYIGELERKVQSLQTQATSLSAQLTLMQRDTTGLSADNGDLKLRLQTMEQQVHLQDALNEALKEEIQHLKVLTGQNLGPLFGSKQQQFYPNNNNSNSQQQTLLTAQQFQQLQIQSQRQQLWSLKQHAPKE